ncbi:hypothetical protein GCM10010357_55710 [Streptomyces luteireticuli]|uniref:Uncharacterized protein n=1 Tax=Streptomyces luteireticuli TaxID=173858 RepID=A0ABP3IU81_9ACTN
MQGAQPPPYRAAARCRAEGAEPPEETVKGRDRGKPPTRTPRLPTVTTVTTPSPPRNNRSTAVPHRSPPTPPPRQAG